MKKILVASQNPVKLNAALGGFRKMFPKVKFSVEGVPAPSEVGHQPIGDLVILHGARKRVENLSKARPDGDYWVGIEGGVEERDDGLYVYAWIAIKSRAKRWGLARSGAFLLPARVAKLVRAGKELGDANDIVFKMKNSKQADGAIGILTHNITDRTREYIETMVLALIPFKNPKLYGK